MYAGILDTEIKIKKHQVTVSDFGDQTDTYTDGATTRAFIEPSGGGRGDINHETDYIYRKHITVRRYVDVDEFDRIELNGQTYRILSIESDRIKNHKVLTIEQIDGLTNEPNG